jgi:hypothetical protein
LVKEQDEGSAMPGAVASEAGVTNILQHGLWVLLEDRGLFLAFDQYPWFEQAAVERILGFERPQRGHRRWPEVEIDLSVGAMEDAERHAVRARV